MNTSIENHIFVNFHLNSGIWQDLLNFMHFLSLLDLVPDEFPITFITEWQLQPTGKATRHNYMQINEI